MGFLGHRLEKIRKDSDFFSWFHLEETGPAREAGDNKILTFKPSGEVFRDLVTLNITLNAEGRILEMELLLARSFINDGANGIFARDIAKSLLRSAIPRENKDDVADLANEIEFQSSSTRPVITATQELPKLPDQPTLGYQVFQGKEKRYEQVLSRCVVRLENAADGLKFSLTNRGSPG
jgi:hypothetical protein